MAEASLPPAEVAAHAVFVRRLAGHLLRDDAAADDAAQATLLVAIERPPRPGPGLHAWFAAVLRNLARMKHRSEGRRVARERGAAAGERLLATDDAAARAEILRVVADAVASLGPAHRDVVMLRHYEGLPPRDIAARLSIPVETVKSRLQRAHAELRLRLDEHYGGNVEGWRESLALVLGWPGTRTGLGPIPGGFSLGAGAKVAAAAVVLLGGGAWLVGSMPVGTAAPASERPGPTAASSTAGRKPGVPGELARAPTGVPPSTGAVARAPLAAASPSPSEAPSGVLVGDVRYALDDAPVVGASVRAFQAITYVAIGLEARTGDDGSYRITGVPLGASVELCVRVRGGATVRATVACPGPTTRHPVRIPQGGTLEGTVTDADGRACVGVAVCVLGRDELLPWRSGRGASAWEAQAERDAAQVDHAETDARGHYAIEGLPLDQERVAVAELGPRRIAASAPFAFHAVGERLRRDLRLERPGSLRVVVTGIAPTAPLDVGLHTDHLWMMLVPEDRQRDGSWLVPELSPGRWHVTCARLGLPFLRREVEIASETTREVELSIRGTLAVEGTVVDPAGTPVPGARVWWRGRPTSFLVADEAGRFRLEGLDATSGTLVAEASDPRAVPGRAIVEDVHPGGEPLRVSIPEPATLRVRLEGPGSEGPLHVRVATRLLASFGPVNERDEDGAWSFLVANVGVPVQLVLEALPSAPAILETGALAPGEVRDLGSVRLGDGRDLDVVVTDAKGVACPRATVVALDAHRAEHRLVADASGRVHLERQPLAPIRITVEVEDRPPHLFTLPATGSGPFSVIVDEGGRLEVRVLDADGAPGSGAGVTLRPADGDAFDPSGDFAEVRLTADAGGLLSTRAQARAFRVRAESAAGYGDGAEVRAVVRTGQTTSLEVRLR